MQPTLPQDIALVLPIIAAAIAHYLMADRLAAWQNALIAALFVVGTAAISAWLSGNIIAGNPQASLLMILAYVAFLMRGPLSTLMLFFADVPSPFDKLPAPTGPSPAPVAIPLPVPPRASAPPPTAPSA